MKYRKTVKNKSKSKRRTYRSKKGGVNNFIQRRNNLRREIQSIINRARVIFHTNINADEMIFVNEIRLFEPEADLIDAHFHNHNMEDMLNRAIEEIMGIFGLIINNDRTIDSNIESIHSNPNSQLSIRTNINFN